MLYAVIDTNVLVSALLNADSKPGLVLLSVFTGKTIPLLNPEIFAEYREVLARKKFRFSSEAVDSILTRLSSTCINVSNTSDVNLHVPDPKDQCFYAVTLTGRKTKDAMLVTGNIRHFPAEPFVVTPARFVELLQQITRF